ncbi:MAG: sugar transferase [Parvibaculum sp.]|nr:sugar transferase [Parvibaculum sp.]
MYSDPSAVRETSAILGGSAAVTDSGWTPRFIQTKASVFWKRGFDLSAAMLSLLFLLPLLIAVAALIWFDSGEPVLFRQRRTGRGGAIFTVLKFRTMTVSEDGNEIAHAVQGDPRVTRVGAFLRVSSIDELPQLLNILRGEMSFVGPRPHALAHDAYYGALLPHYGGRFSVKPGLTGLAQVQGLRGEIRVLDDMSRRVDADVDYANHWSFRDDLLILLRTIPIVLAQKNAY